MGKKKAKRKPLKSVYTMYGRFNGDGYMMTDSLAHYRENAQARYAEWDGDRYLRVRKVRVTVEEIR